MSRSKVERPVSVIRKNLKYDPTTGWLLRKARGGPLEIATVNEAINYAKTLTSHAYEDSLAQMCSVNGDETSNDSDTFLLFNYFIDLLNSKRIIKHNPVNNKVEQVDISTIYQTVSDRSLIVKIPANIIYNPYSGKTITNENGNYTLNTYCSPDWKSIVSPDTKIELPLIYQKFFSHLFNNDEKSIEYSLSWFAAGLRQKIIPFLSLVGSTRGIGKNVLADIYSEVLGRSNVISLKQSFITKEFNSVISDKQLAILDEVSIQDSKSLDNIKLFTNRFVGLEGKQKDIQTFQLSTNFMLLNNDSNCLVGVDAHDDRQFSVPILTTVPLIHNPDFNSGEKIQELFSSENIRQLACYLWNYKFDIQFVNTPLKSEHYKEVIGASKKDWELYMNEQFLAESESPLYFSTTISEQIRQHCNVKSIGRITIKKFALKHPDKFYAFEKRKETKGSERYFLVRDHNLSDSEWESKKKRYHYDLTYEELKIEATKQNPKWYQKDK